MIGIVNLPRVSMLNFNPQDSPQIVHTQPLLHAGSRPNTTQPAPGHRLALRLC